MKGTVFYPNRTSANFTIRHDYDFARGMAADGGKGYHVNVELHRAKYAFTSLSSTQTVGYYNDCVQTLSRERYNSGDEVAAQFFMPGFGVDWSTVDFTKKGTVL